MPCFNAASLFIECNANLYQKTFQDQPTVLDNALDLITENEDGNEWPVEKINA